MNGIRCPKCKLVNLLTAESCHRCGNSFANLPGTAHVSVPVEETFQARAFAPGNQSGIPMDNELGRKTYFWYRVYCAALALLYLLFMGLGIALTILRPESSGSSAAENVLLGTIYTILGAFFALVFIVALFLPRKPYNWIVGIVMIAFGMTSCCFLPATIPLLIFWVKPETKAFFGRY